MNLEHLLDRIPIWGLFIATVVVTLLAVEGGFRFGRYQHQHREPGQDAPVGAMVAATLGLLAFMLAFTFGMAGARFDARKQLALNEANAIGTAYLRAQLLQPPHSAEIQALLREYVDIRVAGATQKEKLAVALARSQELHRLLWSQAVTLSQKSSNPMVVGLFIQSLNEVIDLHSKRITAGLRNRIPAIIWIVLYLLAIMAMIAMGYHSGLASPSRSIVVLILTMAFSAVIYLTIDLDNPREGLLHVSQQAMFDLQQSFRERPR